MSGIFVAVVGPSGVGKDTLLDGARRALLADPAFRFVQRSITRPSDAAGEDHIAVSQDAFDDAEAKGAFALTWRAHGLAYGVPADILTDLANGKTIIANLSRTALDEAHALGYTSLIVSVRASSEVLRARLKARGRENDEEIEARVERASAFNVSGDDVVELWNDTTPDAAIETFLELIRSKRLKAQA